MKKEYYCRPCDQHFSGPQWMPHKRSKKHLIALKVNLKDIETHKDALIEQISSLEREIWQLTH